MNLKPDTGTSWAEINAFMSPKEIISNVVSLSYREGHHNITSEEKKNRKILYTHTHIYLI